MKSDIDHQPSYRFERLYVITDIYGSIMDYGSSEVILKRFYYYSQVLRMKGLYLVDLSKLDLYDIILALSCEAELLQVFYRLRYKVKIIKHSESFIYKTHKVKKIKSDYFLILDNKGELKSEHDELILYFNEAQVVGSISKPDKRFRMSLNVSDQSELVINELISNPNSLYDFLHNQFKPNSKS